MNLHHLTGRYRMATGSGKTLLMHLNILQFIDHIGGVQAFDELQLILTTPGVNLIAQHERELSELVRHLNRLCNNRIKLIVETTGALLNREAGFFNMPEHRRLSRLVLVDEGHIGLASGGKDKIGAFKGLRKELLRPENSFLFEYSATYHGIAEQHVREYEEQIVYDYNYYRFFKDGYGKDYALQSKNDDRFADQGKSESAFFSATFDTLRDKLQAHQQLVIGQAEAGALPFTGRFPDKPLLAFMGNTVEDAKDEGKGKDEVSDIRKFVIWLAHLTEEERRNYQTIFNGAGNGRLTLTRSSAVKDEIWLSWGEGRYWGLINVGNGDKFFADCEEHPQLHDTHGEPLIHLVKADIVSPVCHFAAIDDPASPINVLVGSRKFAEGWNCFRVSIIGLINLGSSKGNKIIQIFGRGVRLKGTRGDGKRRTIDHCADYQELLRTDSPENRLRRLETLNVFSLNRSWLETFLKALEQDLPAIAGPFTLDVKPSVMKVGNKQLSFADYQPRLQTFKVGLSEFDAPLQITLDARDHSWNWQYVTNGSLSEGRLPNPGFHLDYRSDRGCPGVNLIPQLQAFIERPFFLPTPWLQQRLEAWCRQQRVQLYYREGETLFRLALPHLLPVVREALYDQGLDHRSWQVVERVLDEVQRDVLEKIFHKVRYDIDRRQYRFEEIRQRVNGEPGDFIDRYSVSFEFGKEEEKQQFVADPEARRQLELQLKEETAPYHIYEPLFGESTEKLLKQHKLRRIGISPDKLNAGERKFLRDILTFIENNYARDSREFYLMRNVESLRSIGLYLEGETRVFFPDFVLWIVDEKQKKTTLALFDPKGQTGIVKDEDLGLNGSEALNDKVRVATSGQLNSLARELSLRTQRNWSLHSFILLRDSSPLGRFKGSAPTDAEMKLAEAMIEKGVLRLDWHDENEKGQTSVRLRDGSSYLSRIFAQLLH
ncbi:MAG: hypothetical protein Tsb0017_24870 [Geothermobacteraceae bacterium]